MLSALLAADSGSDLPWYMDVLVFAIVAVLLLVIFGGPIALVLWLTRRMGEGEDVMPLYKGISGIRRAGEERPGDVRLVFFTYSGFIIYSARAKHDVVLPADQARVLLRRLVRHNLTYGLFTFCGFLVPLETWMRYRSERKKIDAAEGQSRAASSAA